MSDVTDVQYKCTEMFDASKDVAVRWDDPAIGIDWPIPNPLLSERDKNAPTVAEYFA